MTMKLKFVKRGGAAAAAIGEDDLSVHIPGQDLPDPLPVARMPDLEIPIEVDVTYLNPAIDYQPNTQHSKRMTGSGVSIFSVSLPIVLSDSKGKQVADVNLFNKWTARTTFTLALSRKWSFLEPTDIIDVTKGTETFRMRLDKKADAIPGISSIESVFEDTSIYTQSGNASSSGSIPVQTVGLPVQTYIEFIDSPILRDADNNAGFYIAACGQSAGWKGCVLFKSIDGGASYNQLATIVNAATMGSAISILGNFSSGNIFDESSYVDVRMVNGTLSSTSELNVLNGSNFAILGHELIQFKNATLQSAGIYRLTGLLRGRKGTEWAMTSHIIGDRFILADVNTWQRISPSSSEIGLARYYKAVTIGMTLQQTTPKSFTNTADGLECLSNVLIGGGVDTANKITLNWKRRGRVSAEWRDYVDVPLSEATESYEIDILTSDGLTVKRTISAATTTAAYTAAQQTTDFGGMVSNLRLNLYQLSAVVGRGHVLSAVVPFGNFLSTQWRVYCTSKIDAGNFLSFKEIEMRATVGGVTQCVGGTATADSNNGSPTYLPANAFDGSASTQWSTSNSVFPHWIQYTFLTAVTVKQLSLKVSAQTEAPLAWQLQYFNGTSWVAVYMQTNEPVWAGSEQRLYTI